MNVKKEYENLYLRNKSEIDRHSSAMMNACREKAFLDFRRIGFPASNDEPYLYTDTGTLFGEKSSSLPVCYGMEAQLLEEDDNFYERRIYAKMENGLCGLTAGVSGKRAWIGSLRAFSNTYSGILSKYYARLADTSKNGITALNTMLASDGFLLYVPEGVVLDDPVWIDSVLCAETGVMANRRVLVVLEAGAQVQAVLSDRTVGKGGILSTRVMEVFAGEGSMFELYETENTDSGSVRFSNLYVHQEKDSNVFLGSMTLDNGSTHNYTEVLLAGNGAEVRMSGMAIEDKCQKVDNYTFIDHRVGGCSSVELYKYVLEDSSVGSFAGKVMVREGSQHTKSQQTNRNLCLTRDARMFTRPHLEIYADDVKCGHGATVGQPDENALFYMRQRGIPLQEARMLLISAFVNEVVDDIRIGDLRDSIRSVVEKRLRKSKEMNA